MKFRVIPIEGKPILTKWECYFAIVPRIIEGYFVWLETAQKRKIQTWFEARMHESLYEFRLNHHKLGD